MQSICIWLLLQTQYYDDYDVWYSHLLSIHLCFFCLNSRESGTIFIQIVLSFLQPHFPLSYAKIRPLFLFFVCPTKAYLINYFAHHLRMKFVVCLFMKNNDIYSVKWIVWINKIRWNWGRITSWKVHGISGKTIGFPGIWKSIVYMTCTRFLISVSPLVLGTCMQVWIREKITCRPCLMDSTNNQLYTLAYITI